MQCLPPLHTLSSAILEQRIALPKAPSPITLSMWYRSMVFGGQIPDAWRLGNDPTSHSVQTQKEDLNSRLDLLTGCRGTIFGIIGDTFCIFIEY